MNWLTQLWDSVKSNPLFVAVTSAMGGAILDLFQDYVTTGTIDTSPAGIKKMIGYVVTAVIMAILHLYRPKPGQQMAVPQAAAKGGTGQKLGAIALIALLLAGLTGCPQQSVLAALTNTLGNAASSIANFEGDPTLAQQLQTDTAAAVQAIQNWKPGTPGQNVVQVLLVVENDLNLISQIPGAQEYAPLISLALATVVSIIEIVDPGSAPAARAKATHEVGATYNAPKTSKEFKARWNTICASNSRLAKVTIR